MTYPSSPQPQYRPQLPQHMPVPPDPYISDPYAPAPMPPVLPIALQPVVPSSNVAVWALVTGIVGLVSGWCLLGIPCIAAVLLGHIGVSETRNNAKSGRGMAVAGLIMGYVGVLPAVILFFWLVMGGTAAIFTPGTTPTPLPS